MKECPDCGSIRIVRDAQIVEKGHYNATFNLGVMVYERPDALVLKQGVHSVTRAEVCGDCGYIQVFATEPKKLWFAYQASLNDVK